MKIRFPWLLVIFSVGLLGLAIGLIFVYQQPEFVPFGPDEVPEMTITVSATPIGSKTKAVQHSETEISKTFDSEPRTRFNLIS